MNPRSLPLIGGAVALLGGISYGIGIPAARIAGMGGVNGSNLTMQRSAILVTVLALIIFALGRSFKLKAGEEKLIVAMGIMAGVTGVCYLSSLNFVPVAISVACFYTFPLLLILAAPFTGGGRITPWRIAAFLIAFSGIILCVGPTLENLDWRGLALAFTASVCCATMFVLTAKVTQDRLTLMFWVQLFALPIMVPIAFATGVSTFASISSVWIAVAVSAIGFYAGFTCQIASGAMLKPATAGLLFLIEPVVAISAAALVLNETLLPLQYLGVGLVIGGLSLDVWKQNQTSAPAAP
jgi:drug/metabolite transporter (DMT)-like permease